MNDIEFESDSEDDFEDVRNIQRQPRTVLTEENLKKYLSSETIKLNIEHHHWLKDNFLGKLGRMAPNLKELSIRRLKISDNSAKEILINTPQLESLDMSDCINVEKTAILAGLKTWGNTIKKLQLSSLYTGVDDEVV